MAGLLAPIESTRATFSLDPETGTATGVTEQAVTDASSATIAPDNSDSGGSTKDETATSGKQPQSVIRAWMLAGAERWKKGADARNKRLDIQKARAQAVQVKETRQVSVNRTGGFSGNGGGKGSPNSGSGKSLNRKNSPVNSGAKGPKNSSDTSRNGAGKPPSSGRSNNTGPVRKPQDTRTDRPKTSNRDHTNNGGKGRDRTPDKPKPARTDSGSKKTPASDAKPKNTSSGNSGAPNHGAKTGGQGPAGKPGKDAPTPNKPSPKNNSSASPGGASKVDSKDRPWKDPARKARLDKDPNGTGTNSRDRNAPDKADSASKKPSLDTAAKKTPTAPKSDLKNKGTNTGPGKDPASRLNPTRSTDRRTPRPQINLQTSREAGYRDGTRVAKTTAHARAWRDGVRDGYRDTTAAAERESARLDKAHADRKKTRTPEAPTMPQAQPASPTIPPKPDHQPGPQPVPVTSVDATHVHLGDGADRASISRGEVRTLRNFQQRLNDKTERMTAVAEATRTLEQHAREQAKQVTELLEQARAVQGGEKVVAALTKLAEAAQVQETKAADIHRRAARSADACQALHANTETRYGGIYQAVKDSPETSPAEMAYYRDMETTGV
jgi:urease gamma subunit